MASCYAPSTSGCTIVAVAKGVAEAWEAWQATSTRATRAANLHGRQREMRSTA